MISFGFLLHAGHLAGLYLQPSPFLVPPLTAFRLIPVGYLSFLLFAVLLVWLMLRLNLTGWRAGAIFGLKLGGLRGVPSYIKKSICAWLFCSRWLISRLALAGKSFPVQQSSDYDHRQADYQQHRQL